MTQFRDRLIINRYCPAKDAEVCFSETEGNRCCVDYVVDCPSDPDLYEAVDSLADCLDNYDTFCKISSDSSDNFEGKESYGCIHVPSCVTNVNPNFDHDCFDVVDRAECEYLEEVYGEDIFKYCYNPIKQPGCCLKKGALGDCPEDRYCRGEGKEYDVRSCNEDVQFVCYLDDEIRCCPQAANCDRDEEEEGYSCFSTDGQKNCQTIIQVVSGLSPEDQSSLDEDLTKLCFIGDDVIFDYRCCYKPEIVQECPAGDHICRLESDFTACDQSSELFCRDGKDNKCCSKEENCDPEGGSGLYCFNSESKEKCQSDLRQITGKNVNLRSGFYGKFCYSTNFDGQVCCLTPSAIDECLVGYACWGEGNNV
ncbi:MAG: hypothetical protein KKF44_10380 [Nanoarchaeota archaeon]|nr:hypothetical protein [Nanoarchaeota archaeon]